ncbi:rod shape-determining protein MreD [Slackia heliotrinireducens]|uniref:Rod shape-determining protein MreD n=1 Tax=Slackia heliotrinireducens (strain ATCC 29202 / DSM 20476 / NCTC 11029 / RHS 1) TaxID=471855 RepID=C7N6A7_SLAHD|nr:rod shape-determining protein MreD [Slackia heliotrinireducens]ACV22442.1 rod shape-determining protein MreD [Slackia heliotrinireducens DSM 20476]VEH00797.1 rod shape-determining protein MreD [Slackia heliotrinireducens]
MADTFKIIIGALISIVLQIVVSPNISIFGAQPNIIMVYVVVVSMLRSDNRSVWLAFIMGLAYDLFCNGHLGLTAALLLIASFVSSKAFEAFNNDTLLIPMVVSILTAMFVEIVMAMAYTALSSDVSLLDALIQRSVPCALFDSAMVLIVLPICMRVFGSTTTIHPTPQSTNLRLG